MDKFKGKIVLITGVGAPKNAYTNGKAIAVQFASEGAKVEGVDKNKILGHNTKNQINEEGNYCDISFFDVTKENLVKKWIEKCIKKHNKIDVLVNNVGQSDPFTPSKSSSRKWEKQFELNLNSAFYTTKFVLPHMIKNNKGVIINISSIAGIRYLGKPQVAYSAAKSALIQFTKSSAIIYAKNNIRMNSVLPGFIDTPLVKKLAKKYSNKSYHDYKKIRSKLVPLGHMGSPIDVAKATLFLSSDDAKYITASELVVDGGLTSTIASFN